MANKSYIKTDNNTAGEIKKGWVKTDNGSKSLTAGWVKTGANDYKQIFPPEEYYTVTIDCTVLDAVTFKTSVYPNTSSTSKVATYYVPASATWSDITPTSFSKTNYNISFYTRATTLTSSTTIAAMAGDTPSNSIQISAVAAPVTTTVMVHINGTGITEYMPTTYLTSTNAAYYIYDVPFNEPISAILPDPTEHPPTRTNYIFKWWGLSSDAEQGIDISQQVGLSMLEIFSVFTPVTITVKIHRDGGTISNVYQGYNYEYYSSYIQYSDVPFDEVFSTLLPSYTKANYNFQYWSTTQNGSSGAITTSNSVGTSNLDIYPICTKVTITVKIYKDGGTFSNVYTGYSYSNQTNYIQYSNVPFDELISTLIPTYSKSNYNFDHWSTSSNDSTGALNLNSAVGTGNLNIYPITSIITVQVTLYTHGATFSSPNSNYSYSTGGSGDSQHITYYDVPYNTSLSLLFPSSITKVDYNFEHWSYIDGGAAIANINGNVGTSNLTVHAVWSVIQVEVCIYENEGTLNGLKTGYSRQYYTNSGDGYWKYIVPCTSKISVVIPSSNPTVPPNNSNGWSPYFWRWGLTRTTLTAIDGDQTVGYYSYSHVDIYPVFRPRVDVEKNGATFDFRVTDDYLDNGWYAEYRAIKGNQLSTVLPTSNPTKSGYKFIEWRDSQNSNGAVYGSTIIGWDYMVVYPYFLEVFRVTIGKASYQDEITWYQGSCYVSSNSMEAYYDCTSENIFYHISPAGTPTRYGYTFSRWKDSDGNTVVDGNSGTQLTKSTYISPVWTANYWTATMSYHSKLSGTKPSNLYIQKGQTYSTARSSLTSSSYTTGLPSLTVDSDHTTGYWPTSGYWFKDSIGNTITNSSTPTANRTITASPNIAQHFSYSSSVVNSKTRVSWGTAIKGQAYYIAFKKYNNVWYIARGTLTSSITYMQFANSNEDEVILMVLDRQPSFSSTSNVLAWSNNGYANGVVASNGTGTYFKDRGSTNKITFCYNSSSSVLGTAYFDDTYCYINFNSNAGNYGSYISNANVYVQFSSGISYLKSLLI